MYFSKIFLPLGLSGLLLINFYLSKIFYCQEDFGHSLIDHFGKLLLLFSHESNSFCREYEHVINFN